MLKNVNKIFLLPLSQYSQAANFLTAPRTCISLATYNFGVGHGSSFSSTTFSIKISGGLSEDIDIMLKCYLHNTRYFEFS